MYKVIVVILVLFLFCFYLFISKPGKIVINEKGKVEGIVNKTRALLQGKRFWKYQLDLATGLLNKDNSPRLPSSAEMQSIYGKLRDDEMLLFEKMKPLYTKEELTAKILRMKADSIEISGKWRTIDDAAESSLRQEKEKYQIIIPIIQEKLQIKPQTSP